MLTPKILASEVPSNCFFKSLILSCPHTHPSPGALGPTHPNKKPQHFVSALWFCTPTPNSMHDSTKLARVGYVALQEESSGSSCGCDDGSGSNCGSDSTVTSPGTAGTTEKAGGCAITAVGSLGAAIITCCWLILFPISKGQAFSQDSPPAVTCYTCPGILKC